MAEKQQTDTYAFSPKIDKEIDVLYHKAKMLKKLIMVINTIKASGMYSDQEMQKEMQKIDDMPFIPNEERQMIVRAWGIRQKASLQMTKDTKRLLHEIEKCFED